MIKKTGVSIDYFYTAPKILWYMEEMPNLFSKAEKILFPKDYIIFKLTGEFTTDYSMASRTMLFDVHHFRWSGEICDKLGISQDILPEANPSWKIVGEVNKKAAKVTGLKKGIIVSGGGGDRPCEALGAGVINPGEINIGTGTGTVLTAPLKKPIVDVKKRFDCCCHVVPERWEYEILILTTGASLKWFIDNFGSEEIVRARSEMTDPYSIMDEEAKKINHGSDGLFYYPYPMGGKCPVFNNLAKAVFFGFTLAHTKGHFVRSVLEGVAYQYAESIKVLEKLGVKVKKASIVGGESKSKLWNLIKAAVTGIPIQVMEVTNAASLGSAMLGGIASGAFKDAKAAVKKMVRAKEVFRPKKSEVTKYRKILEKYWKVYRQIEKGYRFIN